MPPRNAERRPRAGAANQKDAWSASRILTLTPDTWQQEEPAYVVRVQVNDLGGSRIYVFRTLSAAQRAVERADKRGRESRMTLCILTPVGVA
jgi:hypothetical protein